MLPTRTIVRLSDCIYGTYFPRLLGQVGMPGVQTGAGMAAETAWRLGVDGEDDDEMEAAAAPATTMVRAAI